ncbi:rhomboid-domain-containing protein [Pleurotus eryngii]|uniref:Rhomboid-domain-containing protein n=1 Tax=Pleurotus eryngii TaxID=5323 RepID=A0A9P6A7B8_PLEER|nr:rhomboid-domain-containing protein [Pleurotus eryngii]
MLRVPAFTRCCTRPSARLPSWALGAPSRSARRFLSDKVPTQLLPSSSRPIDHEIPSFRDTVIRNSAFKSFGDFNVKPRCRSQIIFFLGVSTFGFIMAAANTDVETEYWVKRLSSGWRSATLGNTDLVKAQYVQLGQELQSGLERMKEVYQSIPLLLQVYITKIHVTVAQTYLDNNEGKRICWKICLLNAAVYAAWKFKRFQPFMNLRFMHHPLSGMSYTLLTSMFSHRSLPHLLFNCLALESFGAAAVHYFGKEQAKHQPDQLEATPKWHFLAFYTSAGLFAGLVSHIISTKWRYPRIIAQALSTSKAATTTTATAAGAASTAVASTATKASAGEILPSLGASGAIYACVMLTALAFPETEIALFIPPTFPIPIQWGVGGMLMIDIIGAARGWRVLDHWAHLGGAVFGIFYYVYGPDFWSNLRENIEDMEDDADAS